MYLQISMLRNKIAHDRRWAAEFFRSAVAAKESYFVWVELGNEYLAHCLKTACDSHLETAADFELSARQAERELALLEKSW